MKKVLNVNLKPIIYEKDTNGDYVINTSGETSVQQSDITQISVQDDWSIKVVITEYEW